MPTALAEALKTDDWPETNLFVTHGKVTKSPFRAEETFEKIQHDDLQKLALGKYGCVACLLTYRLLKFGTPYAQKKRGTDSIVRYYLFGKSKFLDMDGWHMRAQVIVAVPHCDLVKVDWDRVVRDVRKLSLEEREYRALKTRFEAQIEKNRYAWTSFGFRREGRPVLPVGEVGGTLTDMAVKVLATQKLIKRSRD